MSPAAASIRKAPCGRWRSLAYPAERGQTRGGRGTPPAADVCQPSRESRRVPCGLCPARRSHTVIHLERQALRREQRAVFGRSPGLGIGGLGGYDGRRPPEDVPVPPFAVLLAPLLAPAAPPRLDADGVPLPAEAICRLGSARFRLGSAGGKPVASRDGRPRY